MYGFYILLTGVYGIHLLAGEFIVNIVNTWLVPSMSEFKLPTPLLCSFHIAKGDVCASRYEQQTYGPTPPQRGL